MSKLLNRIGFEYTMGPINFCNFEHTVMLWALHHPLTDAVWAL